MTTAKPLLDHLAEEFGEYGGRVAEFLVTAAALLTGGKSTSRRRGGVFLHAGGTEGDSAGC